MRTFFVIVFFICGFVKAQLPETDLWFAELDTKIQGKIKTAVNITHRPGYDKRKIIKEIFAMGLH